ncbi:MAG: type I-F CRISPR-associated protein Csy1 [Polyangiaceae bacterium]|nr:type I-F CRISPR-associated protein Csy1 [Polyangiaceae bacterium]
MNDEEQEIREAMHAFVAERLATKLEKLKERDGAKAEELQKQYEPQAWLADAANRVKQIQLASHTLKSIHPDARGTNLHVIQGDPGLGLVGTHGVRHSRVNDVVGNAAALDVYKFLNVSVNGRTLLERAFEHDESFIRALSSNRKEAHEWCSAFASIREIKGSVSSHTLAKQLYLPLDDGNYHLLAPLFPTSLVHAAWSQMKEDRFGDGAKAARQARKDGKPHDRGFREYPNLAIQKLGGTKPQNISQLNSERHGENWILPCLPPVWKSPEVRAPLGITSVFDGAFGRQKGVRALTRSLRDFLEATTHNNAGIRRHRASLVQQICKEALDYAARLRQLPAGWTKHERCRLHPAEKLWLDPLFVHEDEQFRAERRAGDWLDEVGRRFGNWLNASLASKKVALGDEEHAQWTADLVGELGTFREMMEADDDLP